ncbi:2-oxoglutarate dehydrogenase E1 subunit family protein, partial [Mycolicibacterium fortuitum]|uniref:2-oxoglutarate dehydrogenase E1 subunit family protein n=1 Tax=Mycolicibacterium fortuitum TaxID=1766 RepID=UPI001A9748B8
MSSSPSPFGQNEWLVEEMYRKFREDPSSVDPSWHEFLVDYSPEPTTDNTVANGQPAAPVAVDVVLGENKLPEILLAVVAGVG